MLIRICSYTLLILLSALCSCSNSRRLPEGEGLFVGSRVFIKDNEATRKERKVLKKDMIGLVRPKHNTKTLGMRVKLTLYNAAGDTKKKKGLRPWLRNKAGEPPVLASTVNLTMNKDLMVNLLNNKGFFNATAKAKMETNKRKKSRAIFDIVTGPQYRLNEVKLRKDSSEVNKEIDSMFSKTLLTKGSPYNLDVIKAERNRIDRQVKEVGYFYFNPDYILIVADTSIGEHKVNMILRLKHREIPDEAYRPYTINDIFIYTDYRLNAKRTDTSKADAVAIDNYYVIDKKKAYNPAMFSRAMIFEKGDKYSLNDQNLSLSRLVNMDVFKFVKNRFEPVSDTLLDVYYYLTPFPKKSLRFEIGAMTQNDNRAGSQASISWRHRNIFKGAEKLMFKVHGGFESQYSGAVKLPDIYNYGAEASLSFPRFVIPFIDIQTESQYMPLTVIKLKYNSQQEAGLLHINSYSISYGYDWKEGPRKFHQLYPFNITSVKTDTVGDPLRVRARYANLIFNGIILGPTYEFTYNSQVGPPRMHSIYFNGLIDLSGNIIGLVQGADYKTNPGTILGSRYAQYIKLQPDLHYYLRLSPATTIASRVLLGIGYPYGNSSALPNVKQFWAGGNSDLRGFSSRLVGPGTFNEFNDRQTNNYIETLGDLKFEFNTELRQNIHKFLNMAVFFDAGNIWTYNDIPAFPGGKFSPSFYKELAADVGLGLRLDFKILVLRFDLGMPVRKPWLPEGQRWVLDKIELSDPTWKRNNLILNIAIGYPF